MEPRPQRPSRATGPYINTGTPSPTSASQTGYGTGAYDASSAPPAPPPAIGYDPDYSPGQPLTPLKGPRGANIVGPLLAVAALAIIVAAVAFIVSQFRGDGGGEDNPTQQTVVAAAGETPADDDEDETVAAGDDDPTAESGDDGDEEPTQEAAAGQDDGDADPSSTPRVNRPTETDDLGSDDGGEDDTSGEEESTEKTRARQWLPTASGIGAGFEQTENGSRGAEEVIASFPVDQAEAVATALEENGWQENVFRNFTSETAGDDEVYVVSVSVHRFDSEKGAKAALELFAEGGRVGQGLTEVDADKLGEGSVVLQGQIDGGNIYVVYVRQGEFIFRIGGLSRSGDPAEFTTEITNQIIEP